MQPVNQQPQQNVPPPPQEQRVPVVVNQSVPVEQVESADATTHPEVIIYSHSPLFYWWPVWVVGFIMAGITYWGGQADEVGESEMWFHPNSNLGIFFFATLFLVVLITNVSVRGLASALVIVTGILVVVLLAFFDVWDPILRWFGNLRIYLNLGAYFWFSLLMFIVWFMTVFVFDRLSYWRVTPGQMTHTYVFGASAKSFDTDNLVLEKYRDDIFRHWVLGFGSGDLHIRPFGASREDIEVPNVLFIGSKIHALQHLIATEPARFGHTTIE